MEAVDTVRDYSCSAEEVADAKLTTRRETLLVIESLTKDFLRAIASGDDPELYLVNTKIMHTCTQNHSFSLSTYTGHPHGKECPS